jgi:Ni,Fe-hydrogenase III large subunit/Ni,Fe-hydrogenase III component G
MHLPALGISPARLHAPLPAQRGFVDGTQLITACRTARSQGASLVALYGADERDRGRGFVLRVILRDRDGLTVLEHALAEATWQCPDLTPFFPAAGRMQRTVHDLLGIEWDGTDVRPWLRHAAWEADAFPLRRDFDGTRGQVPADDHYAFVKVEGEGVHEIAVGPVHAGIIEPGHFRFQVVGEKVLRLEERLGYAHKGIEKRFETLSLLDGSRLAGRVSGDSTVAYAWAYAQAAEALARCDVPPRALALRAVCLERERIANHLGDLGALGNDGGFAFGLAQFSRLREDVLRLHAAAFGHRLLMDVVVPGGLARDVSPQALVAMREQSAVIAAEVARLREIYDEHAGLQDRFRACGIVLPALSERLGLCGLAARASGSTDDVRRDFPHPPYDTLEVPVAVRRDGDVAARVAVRFDELQTSLRLVRQLLDTLPEGALLAPLQSPATENLALGYVEGWRGPVLVALEAGPQDTVRRCHPHDVSWQNWPVIEHAVIGNIVPDFPLINKSFNLAYSGHDL